ncbi:unnamed protein product, partial [Mesorhabditis belari]|uniref:Protein Wnt n=1 Tax=Mesorhabditis belari TaxID=2138241 RepID=A0AAF3FH62_9BILA
MRRLKILFLLLFLLVDVIEAVGWLSVGLSSANLGKRSAGTFCKELKTLNRRQQRFCRKNVILMDSIRRGAQSSYTECQYQFHKRRWNCTLLDPLTHKVIGDVLLLEGTRESAFVHAISAAGVAYRVTRDCAKGLNDACGCDQTRHEIPETTRETSLHSIVPRESKSEFVSEGCSDNVEYGNMISRDFVDAAEKAHGKQKNSTSAQAEQTIINLHNNRAGRQALKTSLRRECKCHGISGSCEMKTCWDALPSFREIGSIIKDKFDGATEVQVVLGEDRPHLKSKHNQFRRHTHADLVFSSPSPDYCEADPVRGILGTKGRECNATSIGTDGCDLLCCMRGFERRVTVVQEKCNCKFVYCCKVVCEQCTRSIERFYCL